ncbi:MAG: cytochrome P450 [Actinomycetota bacterium]
MTDDNTAHGTDDGNAVDTVTDPPPEDLGSFLDPAVQDDPFDTYATMHDRCPVHRLPDMDLVMVAGYDDTKTVLTDPATFSSTPVRRAVSPSASARAAAAVFKQQGWVRSPTLQRTDPPVHARYRRLIAPMLTKRRVEALLPRIDELCHQLIDAFIEEGGCEFIADFALPLPGIVICEQLGLDAAQYPRFKRWADAMLAGGQRPLTVDEAVEQAEIELDAQHHVAGELERRRTEPMEDWISDLVADEDLSMEELQDLMHQLITGGFETTTTALTTGLWLLIRHPDQLAKLQADRSLLDNFIDESLRVDSPVAGLWRTTTCPVSMGGVDMEAEQSVMVRYAAANRDPGRFTEPEVFDIERDNARDHVAFGWGTHFCVGAHLARAELRTGFTALLDRLDDIELARPLDPLPHEFSFFLRPMKELPIRFTAR